MTLTQEEQELEAALGNATRFEVKSDVDIAERESLIRRSMIRTDDSLDDKAETAAKAWQSLSALSNPGDNWQLARALAQRLDKAVARLEEAFPGCRVQRGEIAGYCLGSPPSSVFHRAFLAKSTLAIYQDAEQALDYVSRKLEQIRPLDLSTPSLSDVTGRVGAFNGWGDVGNYARDVAGAIDKLNRWLDQAAPSAAKRPSTKNTKRLA